MSRRFSRISLVLVFLLSSEVWALGLGDIRMNSALNEPLNARIELLSATPDELDNLTVAMASAETFDRYGIDRPFYLQGIQFNIVRSGRVDGNYVQVRSGAAMAEPFLTFLVEASWSRGRLLREYTVFLDPPTFAPPAADKAPAVQAPSRATPSDSGRIERPAPAPQQARPTPAPAPRQQQQPRTQPIQDSTPFDTVAGGDYTVQRSETLWGIASRVRPDSRLTMNQTMLAIFEANPQAFGGNINVLRAGAGLRIPSADEVFRIDRSEAFAEARRQNAIWSGGSVAPAVEDTSTRPSLTLVPPDDDLIEDADTYAPEADLGDEPTGREVEIEQRIAELEAADVPQQQSLIEIRDNELAALREELARIRGEIYEPPVAEVADDAVVEDAVDDPFAADTEATAEDTVVDDDAIADTAPPTDIIRTASSSEPSLVDRAIEMLTSIWAIIGGAVILVVGALIWFMRRGREDDDDPDNWRPLDSDELSPSDLSATETLRAPAHDDSIMVVEQQSMRAGDETVDAPAPDFDFDREPDAAPAETTEATGQFGSLEDTFSSETAINLDQTDPIAEADFHMAYGLYDQAADLVNGALSLEPRNTDLLTKLCEIYFVWGNRDAFVDAAGRLKAAVGDDDNEDWNKIVIMGQQIAGDDSLFAGASAGGTKAVDLSFDADSDETGALDMEFGADDGGAGDIVDLGGSDDDETQALDSDGGVDFFVEDDTEVATGQSLDLDITREMPSADSTVETPTIEQQFDSLGGTAELPSLDESALGDAIENHGQSGDETAEINLDDLGIDIDDLAETELASLDDLDATSESATLSDTGINEALGDFADITGKNPEIDPDATGAYTAVNIEDTGINDNLLDATGRTQVLPEDYAVDTMTDAGDGLSDDDATMLAPGYGDDADEGDIAGDAETMLASLDDDDDMADFDFAKTEALPKDAFDFDSSLEETGEIPAIASTDVDLDLDDLTAALKVSEAGDTLEQMRDDATVEQPRPNVSSSDAGTISLGPDDMSDDLSDARTMTEVGTKLDLARAYVDMGDPSGARSILEEVLDEGDEGQRQQAQQLLDSLPG
jgi:pilus assembly protein FimV